MKVVIVIIIDGLLKMRGERRKLVERSKKKKEKKVRPVRREDRSIHTYQDRNGIHKRAISIYRSLANIERRTIIYVAIDGLKTGRPTTYRRTIEQPLA